MTIFRAPLTDNKGDVRVVQVATGAVPAQATQFRGLWVTMNGLVCGTPDTGQGRVFQGGIAFEASSGLLLIGDGSATPFKMPMDGMLVDANGAFLGAVGAGQVIHQGVNFINQSTGGNPRVNIDDPPMTFFAGLEYQSNSGSIEAVQARSSEATFVNVDGRREIAAENWIRQEFQDGSPLGTLMEQTITNKCTNYNGPVDEAQSNMTIIGANPEAIYTVVEDQEEIERAGLSHIVSDGKVYLVDNRAGSGSAGWEIAGQAGNLNPHTVSVHVRGPDGGNIQLQMTGGGTQPAIALTPHYKWESSPNITPATAANYFRIFTLEPVRFYFILNQLEESPVASSPIVVQGSAASRAVDMLSWSLTDSLGRSILNNTEGMCAIEFTPRFSASDLPASTNQAKILVDFEPVGDNGDSLGYQNTDLGVERFRSYAGSGATAIVNLTTSLVKGQLYLIAIRWAPDGLQIGYKNAGSWAWGVIQGFSGWNSQNNLRLSYPQTAGAYDPMYGSYFKNLYLWSQDKGTTWLESFFSEVAN